MYSDTMGLCPINPLEFSQWIKVLSPNLLKMPFLQENNYGMYFKTVLGNTIQQAKELGVDFHIANDEAGDLIRNKEVLDIHLGDGHSIQAKDVILALGNFCTSSHPEFRGNPGYFRCPLTSHEVEGY